MKKLLKVLAALTIAGTLVTLATCDAGLEWDDDWEFGGGTPMALTRAVAPGDNPQLTEMIRLMRIEEAKLKVWTSGVRINSFRVDIGPSNSVILGQVFRNTLAKSVLFGYQVFATLAVSPPVTSAALVAGLPPQRYFTVWLNTVAVQGGPIPTGYTMELCGVKHYLILRPNDFVFAALTNPYPAAVGIEGQEFSGAYIELE